MHRWRRGRTTASVSSSSNSRTRPRRRNTSRHPQRGTSPMIDQLNQLADLHQRGVLTDDEFAAAKAKVFST